MRFKITLVPTSMKPVIPINYQYPLSAVIYKVLHEADAEYAAFLHKEGYKVDGGLKRFKLFTFSDLQARFKLRGDRMHILSNPELIVSFHLPEAAQHFIKGLFIDRKIAIADKKSKTVFLAERVEAMAMAPPNKAEKNTRIFAPLSMLVCGEKDEKGDYRFLSPEDEKWGASLIHNWKEKCRAVQVPLTDNEWESMHIKPQILREKPRSRLVTIKAGTGAQTRIKGFYNFYLEVTGPPAPLEVLFNAGCGVYNSLGCGCLGSIGASQKYTKPVN